MKLSQFAADEASPVHFLRYHAAVERRIRELGIRECTRLIVDLRGNLEGFVGSLRLMNYLTPDQVPVGYSLTRKGEERTWRRDQLACVEQAAGNEVRHPTDGSSVPRAAP